MTTAENWSMVGEYLESCNCDVVCPCIPTHLQAKPTKGSCDVILAFKINEGEHGGVPLNGLSFIMALQTPGPMAEGNAKLALYIDEKANDDQRESLGTILGGQAGGMPAMIPDMIPISEMLGIKYVPINFGIDGISRSVKVPGVMDINVEGIIGADDQVMQMTGAAHPANSTLSLAKGTSSTYTDFGFDWDNTGQNGHYAPFEWSGP